MWLNTTVELIPDERVQRIRDAIAANPTAPLRLGILAPGGYGKTTVLAELTALFRAAGIPTVHTVDPGGAVLGDRALLLDDAHLLSPEVLRQARKLAEADGARVIVAARPWPAGPELRELAGALDATAQLRPFDRAQVAVRLAGISPQPGLEELVLAQTGGVPAFVDRVIRALEPDGPLEVPASAIGELGADLEALPADVLTFLLAVDAGAAPHVDLLVDLLGKSREEVTEIAKAARATGLVDWTSRPDNALIPIVRQAIRTLISVDRRTSVRQRLTEIQLERGPAWAESVALAGDLDTALRAADQVLTARGDREAARVAAAALAHRGQLTRSTELFRWSGGSLANAFAVIGLIGTGQGAETQLGMSTSDGPPTLLAGAATLMAHGVQQSITGTPTDALSTLVRAASLLEPADHAALLPDSPAALAALVAVQCGELPVAESVLQRAIQAGLGGVPFAVRHRLLRAWVGLCRGDLTATHERLHNAVAARPPGTTPPPRDWLFAVALEVGLARRTSDLGALRRLWAQAGDAVIRHSVDLYTLLPLGEFTVAAARLGDSDRLAAHLAAARELLAQHGNPPLWTTWLAWSQLHAAIISEQRGAAEEHLATLSTNANRFTATLAGAARCWLDILAGKVDPTAVEEAARDLHASGLRWDAARLAGQAAIRTADRKAMVGLMECARIMQGDVAIPDATSDPDNASPGRLSEREQQVARLVLDGLTYREVGDRLFISAKTVEHHVARMRQRLGSTNRRELLVQLRQLLGR
jgi:DNA-binding NarL/FixJ family response regulator